MLVSGNKSDNGGDIVEKVNFAPEHFEEVSIKSVFGNLPHITSIKLSHVIG